ncbi:hypothetical protein Pst134EA_007515 [Puccinia striiformis f. sp. tritici]|uniref:hypothetical protein n=1 Tax=Puccinia striiformis f. sp. tritici TaxID=168172 RepID=UPI00200876E3|nr:hypothetical protein Pst134EA_007515 [Puccinia striiformis f. sp. tritici]KAH9470249.1 hypothetical protein Pst134EA_007515 [Puccinia striiformis f. sp. tritici]KAI9611139.1 hypothetical protein H4Q26_008989 [Puccinia striiformis f. sp. tritici PST-130]
MLTFLLTLSLGHFLLPIPSIGCDSKTYDSLYPISNADERHCERWESQSMGTSHDPNRRQKEDDSWPPTSKMEPFKNGFYKSNCSRHPLDNEPGPYCIFLNPSLNKGMGMVIISKESFFEASLKNLDFSEEEVSIPSTTIKIVKMPEKGGHGAVASEDFKRGQPIVRKRAVAIFPTDQALWWTEFGTSFRRQAIELLPAPTQNVIASLRGTGLEKSKDEFIASILKQNSFSTYLDPESQILHSALVLEPPVRFNHDCRPNVGYRMDHVTQTLHMVAFREIAAGEELTISYRSSELTRKVRQDSLEEDYGFRCTCSHCQMNEDQGRESGKRIQRLFELQDIHYAGEEWLAISEVKELIQICQKENLPYSLINSHFIVAQVYNAHGRTKEAIYYPKKAQRDGSIFVGPKWLYSEDAQLLSSNPELHHSYSN